LIKKERLLNTFIELLKIVSPSKEEKEISDYITKELVALGFEVINDNIGESIGSNSGNIIAHIKGKKSTKPIFFAAHMDTVKLNGELAPKIIGKRIVNASKSCILGSDDKAAIAAILEAMKCLVENKIDTGELFLVFTVCEEIGLLGSKKLDLDLIKADIGFVFDADGDVGSIITQAPFQDSLDVTFIGKPAHAGICPEKGINSIVAASKAISKIKTGRIDNDTTCNIGVIKGGVAKNIVPEKTKVEAEARSMKEDKLKKVIVSILDKFQKASNEAGTKLEYNRIREYNGYKLSKDELPVKMAIEALNKIGITHRLKETGGGSDTNIFNSKGKKTVNLSSGMENCHTNEEYIYVKELINLSKLIIELSQHDYQ
jgi:tripeptide aminopeptidase